MRLIYAILIPLLVIVVMSTAPIQATDQSTNQSMVQGEVIGYTQALTEELDIHGGSAYIMVADGTAIGKKSLLFIEDFAPRNQTQAFDLDTMVKYVFIVNRLFERYPKYLTSATLHLTKNGTSEPYINLTMRNPGDIPTGVQDGE